MSATQKAHGMDGTLVEPDWPPLTLAEVRALLCSLSRRSANRSRSFPPARGRFPLPESSVRPAAASSSNAITLRCAMRKACERSTAFLRICCMRGAPVPRVLASANGHTAIEIGEWTYEVHDTPDGIDLYEDAISWTPFRTAAHAHSAGQALAQLHLASQGFDAPRRKPQPLVASFTIFAARDPVRELEPLSCGAPGAGIEHGCARSAASRLLQLLAPFHAQLQPLLPALSAAVDAQRSALPRICSGAMRATARKLRPSSTSASPTAPMLSTISPTPSSATSSSGLRWSHDPAHPDDVPVHLDHLACAARWLRIRAAALRGRSRRSRAHDRTLPCRVRAL